MTDAEQNEPHKSEQQMQSRMTNEEQSTLSKATYANQSIPTQSKVTNAEQSNQCKLTTSSDQLIAINRERLTESDQQRVTESE